MVFVRQADKGQRQGVAPVDAVTLGFSSTALAVRQGLVDILALPAFRAMDMAARNSAELALAEVLNNIVEHAYAGTVGPITVTATAGKGHVMLEIVDKGRALPAERLPVGARPVIDPKAELPEGGFGWFLIRSLVENLAYRRQSGRNHMSFCLPCRETGE